MTDEYRDEYGNPCDSQGNLLSPQQNPYNPVVAQSDYGFQPEQMDSNALKWQLSTDYQELEHNLRGEFYDIKDKKWKKMGKPLMNNNGISMVLFILRPMTDKNLYLSNLSGVMIDKIMIANCDTVRENLMNNLKEFNIDKANLTAINEHIKNFLYPALKRCEKGGERSFIKGGIQRVEQTVRNIQEGAKKKGWGLFK